ncbi:probable zinc transporter 10 [Tanacetum coccineum]
MVSIFLIFMVFLCTKALSQCEDETDNPCNNKSKALTLKIIGIGTILITSIIGVCLPLITRSVPALSPDRNLFVIVKAFASGIILATGFMHVLPDSFDMLRSSCLADNPWHKFPFTGFYAEGGDEVVAGDQEIAVLELGIVVHSIVIGLGVGASNDVCTIKPLIAALCFHQMFEGMGLGGCILQAEYKTIKKTIMVFFFSTTTPFGIALGIALLKVYKENSPTSLITVGLLNASSAGLLIYMALVDLLAADFMGMKLQFKSYVAVLLGASWWDVFDGKMGLKFTSQRYEDT